jgi:primosomal protein N' (replication factor Y) (superfamily II helicase)
MIARVLVDVPAKAVDRLFDYLIPATLESVLEIGMRVVVPFGNRELMGFCLEIAPSSDFADTLKPLLRILDIEPYLTAELITVAKEIARESTTVLIRVLETILPAAMRAVYQTKVQIVDPIHLDPNLLALFDDQDEITLDLQSVDYAAIKKAIKNNHLRQIYDVKSKAKARYEKQIELVPLDKAPTSEKQKVVLRALLNAPEHTLSQPKLLEKTGVSAAILKTLEKNGHIRIVFAERYRDVVSIQTRTDKDVSLNTEQQRAYDLIIANQNEYAVFLLHGVTGSGKTEVYLKTIEAILKQNREAIFLVPEISLTPLMVGRIKGRFGDDVAILHSGLSIGEKYDEWRRIIRKEVSIAIGARSAVFAPFEHLGIVVIDECHESSYKQEEVPKYHAIDVALRRAKRHQIPVILGSATPNIETYARAKKGYFTLIELKSRFLNASMPTPELIDMKAEFIAGNQSALSRQLETLIADRLAKKEQTILLINRRGYSNFVMCRNCGHVVMCPNCDISLTYHETERALKCHYCGHKETPPKACPKCGSEHLRFMGTGSQKIESELHEKFPDANVIRMDNDTTRTKNAHEILLDEFEHRGDILLGTQMIAKGLDFPKVTLVGIINADNNLFNADFRSPERTFQLITQVSGRAGRHALKGNVLIQAHNPDHYAIRFAIQNDYDGFYQYEMGLRRLARYIPFYYMAELTLQGDNLRDLLLRGRDIVKTLKTNLSPEAIILGPLIPEIARIKNKYQVLLTIKHRQEPQLETLFFQIKDLYESDDVYINIDRSSTLV